MDRSVRNGVGIAAIGGLAASASGAGVTLFFTVDASDAVIGDTITWTVSALTTGLDASGYFGGFVGSFNGTSGDVFTVTNITPLMQGVGTAPTANGGSIEDVNIFNSALLNTDDPSNPLTIMTFDVVAESGFYGRRLEYTADGIATLFATDFIFESPIELVDFEVQSDVFLFIPSAGTIPMLLGATAASRRRR